MMWGAFNLFGSKKDVNMEEKSTEKREDSQQLTQQPTSPTQTPDPVYSPTPWDEHQSTEGVDVEAGIVARAGEPIKPGTTVANHEAITEALKTVYDPEIPVDIYELGLIYEINIEINGDVRLVMTLTAPGCPVAGILPQQVADAAASVEGTAEIEVTLVWDPPWDMEKMSEDAKLALDMY